VGIDPIVLKAEIAHEIVAEVKKKEAAVADVNWVVAMAECSAERLFERLRLQVKEDVEARNRLRKEGEQSKFVVHDQGANLFTVTDGWTSTARTVRFSFSAPEVAVNVVDNNEVALDRFNGRPTLDEEGHCRIQVEGLVITEWQFRQRALQDLFFPA
jgi:hypothetical protein